MSRNFDWYKRYPKKFIRGVRGLGPDLIGAYAVIIDLIYEDEDSCPNDPHWLGGILGCSSRKAAALIQGLVMRGKLQLNSGGRLVNIKATSELESRSKPSRNNDETTTNDMRRSEAPAPDSNKNNDLGSTEKRREEKTRTDKKRKKEGSAAVGDAIASSGSRPPQPVAAVVESELDLAIRSYNDGAALCPGGAGAGWAVCTRLTANREKALRARLAEVGLEGWRAAVVRATRSDFLSGRAKRGPGHESWGVDLGWLAKAENFAKLTEGKYDNDRGRAQPRGRDSARVGLMDFLRDGPPEEEMDR